MTEIVYPEGLAPTLDVLLTYETDALLTRVQRTPLRPSSRLPF